ncbi:cell division protein FtsK [Spongisporangium articulatum]|uniref:Cell division protein FtsK n=1 Tax=Spongisporangium articulatum TaxID=3362603 RepID=A0ABW8AJE2_9ACTN
MSDHESNESNGSEFSGFGGPADEPDQTNPSANPQTSPDDGPQTGPAAVPAADQSDDQGDELDEGDEFWDRESVLVEISAEGRPVDTEQGAVPAAVLAQGRPGPGGRKGPSKPIVPEWARSRSNLYLLARWWVRYGAYVATYHGTRSPKYAAKTAVWAPVGVAKTTGRLIRWAWAEEGNWGLRQHAATRGDAETWLKLDRQRQRQAIWRWWVTVPTLMATAAGLAALVLLAVWWVQVLAAVVLVPVLAKAGQGQDRRITDRVIEGRVYRKLTADLVRRGLMSLGLAGINQAVAKDPTALSFPSEIHRDGPGHLAVVDLPFGVEATDVIARRGRLASALRLPLDQVWPETDRSHPGRLALWVGYEPASVMPQPVWPLLRAAETGKRVDVFEDFPFGTDPRQRTLLAALMSRNWLFGGQPGSGKTFALRLLVLAAAMDPRVEIRGYELKGVGDFRPIEPVATEYGNGFDDATIAACAAMYQWLRTECERRAKRIAFYAAKGMCPENKVTPELASLNGSGLHPLVVFTDEVQNLFTHKVHGKQAGEDAEAVIKLGRALGVILIIGTQIPDKDSLPTGITRNVNTRFCLSVADQTANDMILGTSMYKNGYRATVFEPVVEAGWGIAVGLGKPGSYRSYYVDTAAAEKMIATAMVLRGKAGTLPEAPVQRETVSSVDLLADLLTVWPADQEKAWNADLVVGLAELRPEVYGGWESEQLTAAVKPHRIAVAQVGRRIDGKTVNKRGITRADVLTTINNRTTNRDQGRSKPDDGDADGLSSGHAA